jgi:cation transport ATPase
MKNNIFLITVILSLLVFNSYAQRVKCPRGNMYNCPGLCGLFIDNNGDGYCDCSLITESNNEKKSDTSQSKEENTDKTIITENADVQENKTTQKDSSTKEEENNAEKEAINDADISLTSNEIENQECEDEQKDSDFPKYPLITIALLTLIPYFFTNILVVLGKMKRKIHRKIWNYILLITFTVSGLLGLFLVLQINYGWMMDTYLGNLTLHVKFGISMAILSIIHVVWHWKYYLKRKNDTNC